MVALMVNLKINAQEWTVPPDQAKNTSTVVFDNNAAKAGEELYLKNCKSCHGDPGKNNVLPGLVPPPVDFASDKYQKNSDGELFYKITQGRGTMPQFKTVLSEEQRWQIIAYSRTFNPDYKPSDVSAFQQLIVDDVIISVNLDSAAKKIIVFAVDNSNQQALANSGVKLFIKRYFGKLEFASGNTNEKGFAAFDFPSDLPGDTFGKCTMIVKIGNTEKSFEKLAVCKPHTPVDIYAKRSLWSWNAHTQWWIILSYLGVVLGIWTGIFYVILLIYRIFKSGSVVS